MLSTLAAESSYLLVFNYFNWMFYQLGYLVASGSYSPGFPVICSTYWASFRFHYKVYGLLAQILFLSFLDVPVALLVFDGWSLIPFLF